MNKVGAESEIQNQTQNPNSNASSSSSSSSSSIPNNQNQNHQRHGGGPRGKSCKGYLFYSSSHKSNSQNPTCVGIPRSIEQVPRYMIGESELEASKEGRTLTDFKYACLGYSVYLDKKNSSAPESAKQAELPFCVGLEIVLDKTAASADNAPAGAHRNKDGLALPQPQTPRSTQSTGDEYFNRFKRNARLVAAGVVKNLNKVGNRIKETVDDILYRRPK